MLRRSAKLASREISNGEGCLSPTGTGMAAIRSTTLSADSHEANRAVSSLREAQYTQQARHHRIASTCGEVRGARGRGTVGCIF